MVANQKPMFRKISTPLKNWNIDPTKRNRYSRRHDRRTDVTAVTQRKGCTNKAGRWYQLTFTLRMPYLLTCLATKNAFGGVAESGGVVVMPAAKPDHS